MGRMATANGTRLGIWRPVVRARALAMVLAGCSAAGPTFAATPSVDEPVLHRSGDWLGVCDNLLACRLYGFADDDSAIVLLSQPRGRIGTATLILRPEHPLHGEAVHLQTTRHGPALTVRSISEAGGAIRAALEPAALQPFLALLHGNGRLAIATAPGRPGVRPKPIGAIRLAGAASVLDWAAQVQRRMPPPATGAVHPAAAYEGPRPTMPPVSVTSLAATRRCLKQDSLDPAAGVSGMALSHRLTVWQIPCGSGNFDSASLFVIADAATHDAVAAAFALPPQLASRPPGILINAEIADDGRRLTATEPSRGLDDCGDVRRYVWDGTQYRLVEARSMPLCHGLPPEERPLVYRDPAAPDAQ